MSVQPETELLTDPGAGLARHGESIYRALARSSVLGFALLERGRMIDCNDSFAEMLGRSRMQVIGQTPWELSPTLQPDGVPSGEKATGLLDRIEAGEAFAFDWTHSRPDGATVITEVALSPVDAGPHPRVLALVRDMSEQRATEQALRASEERFAKAFRVSPDPISITNLEGTIVAANDAFVAASGFTHEELIGSTTLELGAWRDPADRERVVDLLAREGRVRSHEIVILNRAREEMYLEYSAEMLKLGGKPHILAVAHDVTDRKRAEAERARAFEEVSRLKTRLERERDYLREEFNVSLDFDEIVGSSPALKRILAQIEAVASTSASVLISGETGVGKELVARAVHRRSERAGAPLIKVNCAAIPAELFESEFFGHTRGAFTGATSDRVGRFQLADGGTLFLDEVTEIPPELQAKLLRVLEEGEFSRVGESSTRKVDVRLIAATNRSLEADVEAGRFRSDLYYRLSVFPLAVPPLREREADVGALAMHFLKTAGRDFGRTHLALSRAQAEALQQYDWPGNVRELRNVIERAVLLSPAERLRLDLALPQTGESASRVRETSREAPDVLTSSELRALQRRNIVAALDRAGWKVSGPGGAAELLGMRPSTLSYQMRSMQIRRDAQEPRARPRRSLKP